MGWYHFLFVLFYWKQVGCVSHCDLWEVEREDMDHEIARTLETASKVGEE